MVASRDTWTERSDALAHTLARVALGDRAAFATLYKATSAHLFAVILRINPDRAQGEDTLQEIYVNIWRAAQGFDAQRSQPLTWLSSIARNRAIDSLRRRKAEPGMASSRVGDNGEETDLLDAQASPDAGPLALLQQAGEARDLAQCIAELSHEQQQCLTLAFYQGLSHSEVAEHLSQPLGTVKSWVRRAMIALKDCLSRAHAAAPGSGG